MLEEKKRTMDIQARKLNFIQEFLRIADDELVTKLEKLLSNERKKKLEDELQPLTMTEFNEIIDQSEEDFANARVAEAEDLYKQIDKW